MAAPVFPNPLRYQPVQVRVGSPLVETRITEYRESCEGSPDFSFSKGDKRSKRQYYIPVTSGGQPRNGIAFGDWPYRVMLDFLGYSETVVQGGNKYIKRVVPHDHPSFPNFLYADAVPLMEGDIIQGRDEYLVATYDELKTTVTYSAPPYKVLTDQEMVFSGLTYPDESSLKRYVSFFYRPAGYYQSLPGVGTLKFVSDGRPVVNKRNMLLVEADLTVTWHEVPLTAFPITAILDTVGKTNTAFFGLAGSMIGVVPSNRLVCLWPETHLFRMANGEFALDIVYKFKLYPHGANYFYRHDTMTFELATLDGLAGGPRVFPAANYNSLFRPEP